MLGLHARTPVLGLPCWAGLHGPSAGGGDGDLQGLAAIRQPRLRVVSVMGAVASSYRSPDKSLPCRIS